LDEYFLDILDKVATRATCDRGHAGCVITKNNHILATGYVGSAIGDDHCDEAGHQMQKRFNADGSVSEHCVRTIHAEQNAICQAAMHGVSTLGGTLYCRMTPCPVCAKMLINCGIIRVVCQRKYQRGEESIALFKKCGIEIVHLVDEVQTY
jgi:dCMP deaminase